MIWLIYGILAGLIVIGFFCIVLDDNKGPDMLLGGIFALVLAAGLATGLALAEVHVPQHTRSAPVPR